MATAPNRNPREVVEFAPNVPVTVALKFNQGKIVSGQYGERVLFTLTDDRVMFLSPEVAGQITQLGVNVRENFTITKSVDAKGAASWHVERAIGEQPNGTLVLPKPPASATAPMQAAESALVTEAKALVDDFATVLEYGLKRHEGRVKPEEDSLDPDQRVHTDAEAVKLRVETARPHALTCGLRLAPWDFRPTVQSCNHARSPMIAKPEGADNSLHRAACSSISSKAAAFNRSTSKSRKREPPRSFGSAMSSAA